MNNQKFEGFFQDLSGNDEYPEVHLGKVEEKDLADIKPRLNEILRKGVGFKVEANYFTPDESKAALTGEERDFLKQNRKAVLCALQLDAIRRLGLFENEMQKMEFNLEYMQKLNALLNTSYSHGTLQDRATKAMHEVAREWFKRA